MASPGFVMDIALNCFGSLKAVQLPSGQCSKTINTDSVSATGPIAQIFGLPQ